MEGTPKAIQIQGICRNATKIDVQDGQAEDLINLRFMDGSWRASGDGRLVHTMSGTIYEQLYVHTNVYHHLLGVAPDPNNNDTPTLWWFANIENDGVTFTPLTTPVAVTTVEGDIWITQTGHLLTIIDENDDFEYFIFKTGDNEYVEVKVDVNGQATDRSIYPFGKVHFNLYEPSDDEDHVHIKNNTDVAWSTATIQIAHADMLEMFAEAKKKNQFTGPFFALVACRLYDGSHAFASQPVLIYPRDITAKGKSYCREKGTLSSDGTYTVSTLTTESFSDENAKQIGFIYAQNSAPCLTDRDDEGNGLGQKSTNPIIFEDQAAFTKACAAKPAIVRYYREQLGNTIDKDVVTPIPKQSLPVYCGGIATLYGYSSQTVTPLISCVHGADLVLSIENSGIIDGKVIVGIDVFITNPADIIDLSAEAYKESVFYDKTKSEAENVLKDHEKRISTHYKIGSSSTSDVESHAAAYIPKKNTDDKIRYDLLHSPFYLLRSYSVTDLPELESNKIVDLSQPIYDGLLENIVQQKQLDIEALARTTYLPKVSYMYNGRLHIANYKSHPFFGYPIDLFHLHNHSVKVQDGAWFPANEDRSRALPNIVPNNDDYLQYAKTRHYIAHYPNLVTNKAPYYLVKVYIDSSQGEQVVCRYIEAYNPNSPLINGRADFIEDLNPLLTYPDARAKKMEIYYINDYLPNTTIVDGVTRQAGVYAKYKSFDLKPHPYLNMAYYIDPELKPIKLSEFSNWNPNSQPIGGEIS